MARLSVLDLATVPAGMEVSHALVETTTTALAAEAFGYDRFWVAEHHGMKGVASSAPAVLLSHVGSKTSSIRIGAGGVMLPNHAPLVVAEQFGTLEALYRGRVDLGLGRAPGTDPATARAIGRGDAERFPDDVIELVSYFSGTAPVLAVPGNGLMPQLWLLGSSTFSAQLAAHFGLPFSFAYHFAPELVDTAVSLYRDGFRPSVLCAQPHVMVAATVLCAPSDEEAAFLAGPSRLSMLRLRQGRPTQMVSPHDAAREVLSEAELGVIDAMSSSHIVGSPHTVAQGLHDLEARTGADEIMVSTRSFGLDDRVRSIGLVAHAMAMTPRS